MPNPFLEDEDETNQPDLENQNFKQLRDYAKKLERQVSSASKELEQLRQFQAEVQAEKRAATVAQVFKKVGLSEKHAGLFAKINADAELTEEAVIAFASEYDQPRQEVQAPEGEASVEEISSGNIVELNPAEAQPAKTGFAPAQPAGVPSGTIITSYEEAVKLQTSNPAEFARLFQAGRVKLDKLPGSGESRLPG